MEIASLALRAAASNPRICDVIFVAMAKPAASSDAELIRSPVDRRSIATDMLRSLVLMLLAAVIAAILVLIVVIVLSSKIFKSVVE